MNDGRMVTERLLDQAREEQSFRRQISAALVSLLRDPLTGRDVKIYVVVILALLVGLSFYITGLLLYVVVSIFGGEKPHPAFLLGIPGMLLPVVGMSIPLIRSASETEQAVRLRDTLESTSRKHMGLDRGR